MSLHHPYWEGVLAVSNPFEHLFRPSRLPRKAVWKPTPQKTEGIAKFDQEYVVNRGSTKLNVAGYDPTTLRVEVVNGEVTVSSGDKTLYLIEVDPNAIVTATYQFGILEIQANIPTVSPKSVKIEGLGTP